MSPKLILVMLLVLGLIIGLVYLILNTNKQKQSQCPIVKKIITNTKTSKILNIPPRRMWGWGAEYSDTDNDTMVGYCGETAVQSSMIYYGNYVSQEQVYKAGGGPFLIGNNSDQTYTTFQMIYEYWPNKPDVHIDQILEYIKSQIDLDYPLVMGFFINEQDGDPSFDHEVPVFGYNLGDDGKINTLYFNDAYQLFNVPLDCSIDPKSGIQKCYKTRNEFSDPDGVGVAPYANAIPNIIGKKDGKNDCETAIVSVKGNIDLYNELFPTMLEMDSPFEPNWGNEDQLGVTPQPLSCSVLMSNLTSGKKYSLLRFDNPSDIPTGHFLESGKFTLKINFSPTCSTYKIRITHTKDYPFMSDGTYFFRCVKNTSSTNSIYPVGTDRVDHTPGVSKKTSLILSNKHNTELIRRNLNTRKNNPVKRKKKKFSSIRSIEPCTNGPWVNPGIVCGDLGIGQINRHWEWTFPDTKTYGIEVPNLGCFSVFFDVTAFSIEMPVCVKFNVTAPNGEFKDPVDGSDTPVDGTIGLDGRMYIENYDSFQTFAFSLDVADKNGAYTMLSQDGVTISVLRPVA